MEPPRPPWCTEKSSGIFLLALMTCEGYDPSSAKYRRCQEELNINRSESEECLIWKIWKHKQNK